MIGFLLPCTCLFSALEGREMQLQCLDMQSSQS